MRRVIAPAFTSIKIEAPVAQAPPWQLENYRAFLRLQVRQLYRDPRLERRFDSSDLVQETLLKAHQKLDQFRGQTAAELVKWLQEILVHTLADAVRQARAQKRDVALDQSLHEVLADSSARVEAFLESGRPSPLHEVERGEMLLRLTAAMEELPEDQHEVVMQRDLLGLPVAQIAAHLGRTEKSVAGLLLRGRRRLRALLFDYQG